MLARWRGGCPAGCHPKELNRTEEVRSQLVVLLGLGSLFTSLLMLENLHPIAWNQGLLWLGSVVCLLAFPLLLIDALAPCRCECDRRLSRLLDGLAGLSSWARFQQIPSWNALQGTVADLLRWRSEHPLAYAASGGYGPGLLCMMALSASFVLAVMEPTPALASKATTEAIFACRAMKNKGWWHSAWPAIPHCSSSRRG